MERTWIFLALEWEGGFHGMASWPLHSNAFLTVSRARWMGGCGLTTPSKSMNPKDKRVPPSISSWHRQGRGTTSGSLSHACDAIIEGRKNFRDATDDPRSPGTVGMIVCPGDYYQEVNTLLLHCKWKSTYSVGNVKEGQSSSRRLDAIHTIAGRWHGHRAPCIYVSKMLQFPRRNPIY